MHPFFGTEKKGVLMKTNLLICLESCKFRFIDARPLTPDRTSGRGGSRTS